jgi:ABC-type phosphate/phosphonate transport system permease subunit
VKRYTVLILNFFFLAVSSTLAFAEGVAKAEPLQKTIDLAKLSGLNYFFASWYNDNMWLYAIMVTVIMGVIGLLIALVTDVILKMIGMEVHKMEHHE